MKGSSRLGIEEVSWLGAAEKAKQLRQIFERTVNCYPSTVIVAAEQVKEWNRKEQMEKN